MNEFSERRLTENEAIFKKLNGEVKDFVLEDASDTEFARKKLNFYCECSDLRCRQRIILTAKEYEDIHKNKKQFIIKHNHHIPEIEKIVSENNGYILVEKFKMPPEAGEVDIALLA